MREAGRRMRPADPGLRVFGGAETHSPGGLSGMGRTQRGRGPILGGQSTPESGVRMYTRLPLPPPLGAGRALTPHVWT